MIISELKKSRLCISPLSGILAILIITFFLKTAGWMHTPAADIAGFISMSCLILLGSVCSLFIHEYAHALAAKRVGLSVKEITVSLVGACMLLDREPLQPKETIIVSIAGPVANILVGIILYAGYVIFPRTEILSAVFFYLSGLNCLMGIYNLIPVIPLDGGLILRSILWRVSGNWTWSTRRALFIGNGLAVLCIIAGIMILFSAFRVIGALLLILGLSSWQSAKSSYQRMLAVRILTVVTFNVRRKEVMRDAVR
jgi:Zn-dependent protease